MSTDQIFQVRRPTTPRVALLIDGENVSAAYAGRLITQASAFGCLTVKCVFGDIGKIGKWGEAPGFRLIHTGTGKNATDIRLVIEALELAYMGRVDAFALAASDGDYVHLAQHLVERGFPFLGLGGSKTPEIFRKSCTKFVVLETSVARKECEVARANPKLENALSEVISKHAEDGWIKISTLGSKLKAEHGLTKKDRGRSSWKAYFQGYLNLYTFEGSGNDQKVRLKKT